MSPHLAAEDYAVDMTSREVADTFRLAAVFRRMLGDPLQVGLFREGGSYKVWTTRTVEVSDEERAAIRRCLEP